MNMKFNDKYLYKPLALASMLLISSSCELTNLDVNTNPNAPANASVNLLLSSAEFATISNASTLLSTGSGFAGQMNVSDDYNVDNSSYGGTWNYFYRTLQDNEQLIAATKDINSPHYLGIAQVLKAYNTGNFVDMFGDIPYSEAWKATAPTPIITPKFDKDSDVYEDLIKLCDAAVVNFAKTSPVAVKGDIFYNGNIAKWTKLAKTVKLRLLLNSRKGRATGNSDLAKAFTDGGLLADTGADDFVYNFGSAINPNGGDGRHPWFRSAYLGDNGFSYISHQLMQEMLLNKDPRFAFYFYRQSSTILNPANPTDRGTIPYGGTYLVLKPKFWVSYRDVFGTPKKADSLYVAGFFGRDRGDNTGAPADGALRTAPGCYPSGGLYSGRETTAKALTGGTTGGNGVYPMITSVNLKFYQIEAILDGGLAGDARKLFEAAIRDHITKVVNLGLKVDAANAKSPSAVEITDYVNAQLKAYDAAPSNTAKLNIVMKQAWFSYWGQGVEIWNAMRRTGYPTAIQNPILKPQRQFALRLPYPSQEGNLNPNAADKVASIIFDRDPVFWDKVLLKWQF